MIFHHNVLSVIYQTITRIYQVYKTSFVKHDHVDRSPILKNRSLVKLYHMKSIPEKKNAIEFIGSGSLRYPADSEYIASLSYYLNASLDFKDGVKDLETRHTYETSTAHIRVLGELLEGYEILRRYRNPCNIECIGVPLLLYNVVDESYVLLYNAWISDIHISYDRETYSHITIDIDAYSDESRAHNDRLGIIFIPYTKNL